MREEGQVHGGRADREDLATRTAGVLRRGVEQDTELGARVGDVLVVDAADGCAAGGRGCQTSDDAHRRGLAGTVGAEEAGDGARSGFEGDVVDGLEAAVRL